MTEVPQTILTLGALLLLGLVAEGLGRRTPVPRVTLLLLIGVLAGPAVLDLLPAAGASSFPIVANIALVMIGFLLGGEFTGRHLREIGGTVLGLALAESVTTAIVVSAGLLLLGVDVQLALPLGGVAAATAPAATLAVLQETDARGRFAEILKGVVAVDDVMAILLFSVLLAAAGWITGEGLAIGFLWDALREVGGAVALGLALGLPAAALTGRLQPGRASLGVR